MYYSKPKKVDFTTSILQIRKPRLGDFKHLANDRSDPKSYTTKLGKSLSSCVLLPDSLPSPCVEILLTLQYHL
jgi:hypothetical protein